MIQIKRSGQVAVEGLEAMRAEFARRHCVLLPGLLEPPLLQHLLRKLAAARLVTRFERGEEEEFGKVLFVPDTEVVLFVFHLLLNNRSLFRAVKSITGCAPIGNFFGRIHSSVSGDSHYIDWHGDNADHRLLGLTINLSLEEYQGGVFQLREKESERIIYEVARKQAGDAFVFRIAPDLQHRLTPVESSGHRTVGVGWFRAQPDFRTFAARYFRSFDATEQLGR